MLRRVVDLTLTSFPTIPSHTEFPPMFADFETIGKERPRRDMQKLCSVRPIVLDQSPQDIFMEITMGHSGPHTHCDVFKHDWLTLTQGVKPTERWAVRDTCYVSAKHFIGPAAVIDLSDLDGIPEVDTKLLKERAGHVRPRDIVLMRTGDPERLAQGQHVAPQITIEAADWLVTEKGITCFASDLVGNGNFRQWLNVERYLYRSGVLMIDDVVNMENIKSERVFVNGGVVCKFKGVDDSPCRLVVLEDGDDLSSRGMVDLFQPMKHTGAKPEPPFEVQEPLELRGDIMKRFKVRGFHFYMSEEYGDDIPRNEDIGWVTFKRFMNRIGTSMEFPYEGSVPDPLPEAVRTDSGSIASDRLFGRAVVIDAPVGTRQNVTVNQLRKSGREVREGDIVIVRTGFAENYYYRDDFLIYTPGFEVAALEWLVKKGMKILVTDSASIEENGWERWASRDGHSTLFHSGVPVVLSAGNLWSLQKDELWVFCSPLPLDGLNASPVRVIGVEEYA